VTDRVGLCRGQSQICPIDPRDAFVDYQSCIRLRRVAPGNDEQTRARRNFAYRLRNEIVIRLFRRHLLIVVEYQDSVRREPPEEQTKEAPREAV
jgi:hypothetical protein